MVSTHVSIILSQHVSYRKPDLRGLYRKWECWESWDGGSEGRRGQMKRDAHLTELSLLPSAARRLPTVP